MSYKTIVELIDLVAAEQGPERKMALLEELRKVLNEEKEMLQANLRNFFPRFGLPDQSQADWLKEETNAQSLRERAEGLKMKASDLLLEADALMMRAERVGGTDQENSSAKPDKAFGHTA